jgi:WD40 repeat protein
LLLLIGAGTLWLKTADLTTAQSPTRIATDLTVATALPMIAPTLESTSSLTAIFSPTTTSIPFTAVPTAITESKWIQSASGISQVTDWKTGMGAKKVGLAWPPANSKELSISQYQLAQYNSSNGEINESLPCASSVVEYSKSASFLMTGGCTGSQKGSVLLWKQLVDGSAVKIGAQNDGLADAVLSPDEKTVATSGNSNNLINVWNIADGSKKLSIQTPDDVQDLDYSSNGKMIASAHPRDIVVVWDVQSGQEIWRLKKATVAGGGGVLASPQLGGGYYGAIAVKFSPDSKQLAVGYRDGIIALWDLGTGKEIYAINAHDGGAFALSFTGDGQVLASGGEDVLVKL